MLRLAGLVDQPANKQKKQKEAAPEGQIDRSIDRTAKKPKKRESERPETTMATCNGQKKGGGKRQLAMATPCDGRIKIKIKKEETRGQRQQWLLTIVE